MQVKKIFWGIVLSLCITFSIKGTAYADTVTLPNDGSAMDVPYGDTGMASSFKDLDYYDCYIPYKLRITDVGGWANRFISGKSAYNFTMNSQTQQLFVGQKINKEYDDTKKKAIINAGMTYRGMNVSTDESGMNVYTDSFGNQYYAVALPEWCYLFGGLTSGASGSGFPGFSSANRGQYVDVILTDGTCIHFIVHDAKASSHTNNESSYRAPSTDECVYGFTELLLPQYKNMFQAAAGETLEVFCSNTAGFVNKYNISTTGNKVAIIRMYNGVASNGSYAVRNDGVGTAVSYKLGDSVKVTTPDGTHATGSSSLTLTGSTLVEEWELLGMPAYQRLDSHQLQVKLPTIDDMSAADATNVVSMGEYIRLMSQASMLDRLRVGVVALGIIVVLYGIALILGILFDRSNNFVDISAVNILTFGNLRLLSEEDLGTSKAAGYASTGRMILVSAIVIVVGFLILSSGLARFIGEFIYSLL